MIEKRSSRGSEPEVEEEDDESKDIKQLDTIEHLLCMQIHIFRFANMRI